MMEYSIDNCFYEIKNGANIKQGDKSGGFPITRIETLSNNKFNRDRMGYAGIKDLTKYQDYILNDGDILMSHINSPKYLGRAVMYKALSREKIIHGMNLLRLKPNINIIRPEYAEILFYSSKFKMQIFKIMKKSVNQASFSVKDLKKIMITVPDLLEQEKIITKLNRIKKLSVIRLEELKLLDDLIKSRFVEMFGDLVKNTREWEVHQLSEYIEFLTSGSRGWAKYYSNSGEYFITIKNVKDCRITLDNVQYIEAPDNAEAKRTKVREGDLLISITADLGRTGVVSKDIADYGAYINQHLTCIRLNKDVLNPLFVAYYMESEAGRRQFQAKNQNAVKAGLNFDSINSLKLIVPPLDKQDDFISFVKRTDKSKVAIQKSIDELNTLKASLMQEYFG